MTIIIPQEMVHCVLLEPWIPEHTRESFNQHRYKGAEFTNKVICIALKITFPSCISFRGIPQAILRLLGNHFCTESSRSNVGHASLAHQNRHLIDSHPFRLLGHFWHPLQS